MIETQSICEHCYRHISAQIDNRADGIWLMKNCDEHGTVEYQIEDQAFFYDTLVNNSEAYDAGGYVVEVTDRCNLQCPHCYQEPDNKKVDKSIESIVELISRFPKDEYSITLAGAEPTMRPDLCELVTAIKGLGRSVNLLTNGLKLSDAGYVESLIQAGCDFVTIGLNHPDYQGVKVHEKQLAGIETCRSVGMRIKNINYTIENLDQVDDILVEIQQFGDVAEEYRIRGGSDIGRCPDQPRLFLSGLVRHVHKLIAKHRWSWEKIPADDNIYHWMLNINGITHRLIQWADVKTVVLSELECGPWGSFTPGAPMTNLMHQVILRDRVVNQGVALIDTVPDKYARK